MHPTLWAHPAVVATTRLTHRLAHGKLSPFPLHALVPRVDATFAEVTILIRIGAPIRACWWGWRRPGRPWRGWWSEAAVLAAAAKALFLVADKCVAPSFASTQLTQYVWH